MSVQRFRHVLMTLSGPVRVRVVVRAERVEVCHSGSRAAMFGIGAIDLLDGTRSLENTRDGFGCPLRIRCFRDDTIETLRMTHSVSYARTLAGVSAALLTPQREPALRFAVQHLEGVEDARR